MRVSQVRETRFSPAAVQLQLGLALLIIGALLKVSAALAQPTLDHLQLKTPFRYDHREVNASGEVLRSRLQYQFGLRYDVRLGEGLFRETWSLRGLVGTGEKYTSQWNRFVDYESSESIEHPLHMRQIFLQISGRATTLQVGVIPPVKGKVSATSLDRDGWLRGGRMVYRPFGSTQLEIVGGALDRLNDPNAFQAWERLNYGEFEWTQNYGANQRTELGVVRFASANHGRLEYRQRIVRLRATTLEYALEGLYNFKTETVAYDINTRLDWKPVMLRLEYSWIPESFGLLGALANDFFTHGALWQIGIDYYLPLLSGFNLFIRGFRGEELSEFKGGLNYVYRYDRITNESRR